MSMETCKRCDGSAIVTDKFGMPGQDRHQDASAIIWDTTIGGDRICPVCEGTGQRKKRWEKKGPIWVFFTASGDVDHERTVNYEHEQGAPKWTTGQKHLTW